MASWAALPQPCLPYFSQEFPNTPVTVHSGLKFNQTHNSPFFSLSYISKVI